MLFIFGFIIGLSVTHHWIGGLLGVFIAYKIRQKIRQKKGTQRQQNVVLSSCFASPLTPESLYIQSLFSVMGHISKSKGRVLESDIAFANTVMAQMQLNAPAKRLAQHAFNQGKSAYFPLTVVVEEFYDNFRWQKQIVTFFWHTQITASVSDGLIEPNEYHLLRLVAQALYLSEAEFKASIQQYTRGASSNNSNHSRRQYQEEKYSSHQDSHAGRKQTLEKAYHTLGLTSSADHKTVKQAYRRLVNQYHPDKLASKNLSDETMEKAKIKTQEIINAYKLICESKAW